MEIGEQQNISVYRVHITSARTSAIAGYAIVVFIILSFFSSFFKKAEFFRDGRASNFSSILLILFFLFLFVFPKLIRKKGEIRVSGKELIISYNGEEKHLAIDSNLFVKTRPKGGWVCTLKNNLDVDLEVEFLSGIDLTKFMKQILELQGGHPESNLNKAINGAADNLNLGGNPIEQIDSKKQIIRLFVGVVAAVVLYLLYIKLGL
jgi:hypothetical protein